MDRVYRNREVSSQSSFTIKFHNQVSQSNNIMFTKQKKLKFFEILST